MIIQALLILGVLILFGWFLLNPRNHQVHAWIKILTLLFTLLAIIVILIPNTANDIAHLVGVGRGADLLLYLLSLAFVFVVINLYIKNKEEQRRFVKLARKVALLEAEQKYKK
jgi:hypothetical protein